MCQEERLNAAEGVVSKEPQALSSLFREYGFELMEEAGETAERTVKTFQEDVGGYCIVAEVFPRPAWWGTMTLRAREKPKIPEFAPEVGRVWHSCRHSLDAHLRPRERGQEPRLKRETGSRSPHQLQSFLAPETSVCRFF